MPPGRRTSSASSTNNATFKFPNYPHDHAIDHEEHAISDETSDRGLSPARAENGSASWQPRKRNPSRSAAGGIASWTQRRGRQKSLSEALMSIHKRRASVTEGARELGEALKAPVSPKLIASNPFHESTALCGVWYMTSIFSNASSKAILIAFRKPVTLTLVQFAFVYSWCILSAYLAHLFPRLKVIIPALKHEILRPNKELIMTTLPLTAFQIGGHILNSDAMARIPVSLVHTIKGLSPLFTVLAYRLFFHIHYTLPTYLSLVPLTLGVIMACSANFTSDFIGLLYAFGSAMLFVTQNIVSKRLFNEAARAETEGVQQQQASKKPDKLNLLCYSSALAFLFTLPIWLWSELPGLLKDFVDDGTLTLADRPDALDHGRLALEFIFNGTFHFAQSLVAFVLLSMVSPVSYSVASLIKRVFVIVFAVVWFGNPLSRIQSSGILLTFVGLYLYDRINDASRADRKARTQAKSDAPVLPLISESKKVDLPARIPTPLETIHDTRQGSPQLSQVSDHADGRGPPSPMKDVDNGRWLRPGTKQEATWRRSDSPLANGAAV